MRYRTLLMAGALLVAASGCEDEGSGATGPEDRAVIEGRVESTTAAAASGQATTSSSTAQAASVEVVAVGAGGSTDVLAEAAVESSGTFRIEDVPEGRTDLIVVARDETEADVGRVLVHGETEAEVVTVVAPIGAETSIEGGAFVNLKAEGRDDVASNTGGLAAFVRLSGPEAEAVASAAAGIGAVAHAYAESEATLGASLSEFGLDLDGEARGAITTPLALQYATSRDGGADVEQTHEAFVEAVLGAYVAAGASARDMALATAASAHGGIDASSGLDGSARLAVIRQSVATNLRARQNLAADFSGFAGANATVEALAQARGDLENAETMADVEADLEAVATSVEAAVVGDILDLLSEFSLSVRTEVEGRIEDAFVEADLAERLAGESSAQARAAVLAQYRTDVEAAVAAVADAMPAGVSLDTEAMVSLLIAACASAAIT